MNRLVRLLPWLSLTAGLAALALIATSVVFGVWAIGLDMGARLLFLAILPLAALPWIRRRRPGIVLPP